MYRLSDGLCRKDIDRRQAESQDETNCDIAKTLKVGKIAGTQP